MGIHFFVPPFISFSLHLSSALVFKYKGEQIYSLTEKVLILLRQFGRPPFFFFFFLKHS